MWLARETDGTLLLILDDAKPERGKEKNNYGSWICTDYILLDTEEDYFNDITWEEGPVEIVMKKRHKKI